MILSKRDLVLLISDLECWDFDVEFETKSPSESFDLPDVRIGRVDNVIPMQKRQCVKNEIVELRIRYTKRD